MSVLVLALQSDIHADAVVYHLNNMNVKVFRIDPTIGDTLPKKITMSFNKSYAIKYDFKDISLNPLDCTGVFCRFAIESLEATSENPIEKFSASETLTAFLAPLRLIERSRWINDPWLENRVDCKIFQSQLAQEIGLKIPQFIISENYNELISFYNYHQGAIIKPLSDASLAQIDGKYVNQENVLTNDFLAPYANDFTLLQKNELRTLNNTPTFLQQKINKIADIRVTVVDDKIFAAIMPFVKNTKIDFRLNNNKNISKYDLPNDIQEKLFELVRRMGMRFASCDLVLTETGDLFFLEANVQGNWLWTENSAKLPISMTIATALIQ